VQGRRQRGFSVVELLTVLAIIAVVAAVAMPLYWRAGQRLVRDRCLANVRQVGLAFALFSLDHQGRYPAASPASPIGPFPLGSGFPVLSSYVSDTSVFYCPANRVLHPAPDWSGSRLAGYAWWARYATGPQRVPLAGVAQSGLDPGGTVLLSDIVVTPVGRPDLPHPYASHQGGDIFGGFVLCNDGHVRWRDFHQMRRRLSGVSSADWYF
jgi:prepilin-type N-terminal cleavage/methylation domain-containing protein